MPFPRLIARSNRYLANPVLGRLAGQTGPLAMLDHVGRKSGTRRHLPVMVFRQGNTAVIALTYGRKADWVRNVLAAGECTVRLRGQHLLLTDLHLENGDPSQFAVPKAVNLFLHLMRVRHFLHAHLEPV